MGMRFDVEDQFAAAQAFTGAATLGAYSKKMPKAGSDPSIGRRMAALIIPTVAAGAGSTHTMEVVQADDAALTTNLEVIATKSILAAALTVGSEHEVPIPQGSITKLYIGFRNTSTGGATTVTTDVYYVPQDENAVNPYFPKVVDAKV